MALKPDQEPSVWLTVLKLVLVAVCLIGGVGLALWVAGETQEAPAPASTSQGDWGIVGDSPVRFKR
jgi:hypothetical protein